MMSSSVNCAVSRQLGDAGIDNFKMINDSYGHQTGDAALHMIAQAVKSCVRSSDAVVRYGGDEFVIVLWDIPKNIFERKLAEIQKK